MSIYMLAAAFLAFPPEDLDFARDYLRAAILQREALSSGTVVVRYTHYDEQNIPDRSSLLRCYFDTYRYRVDVLKDSEYRKLDKESRVPAGQPFESNVWDGSGMLLTKRFNVSSFQFQMGEHPKLATSSAFNALFLGFPKPYGAETSLADGMQLGFKMVGFEEVDPDIVEIKTRCQDGLDQSLVFRIDKAKNYALAGMRIYTTFPATEDGAGKLSYVATLTSQLERRADGIWFPKMVRHEQRKNGELEWAHEFEVISADFNSPLPENTFSWMGMGISNGDVIMSTVSGIPSRTWTGSLREGRNPAPAAVPPSN